MKKGSNVVPKRTQPTAQPKAKMGLELDILERSLFAAVRTGAYDTIDDVTSVCFVT